jgi:hypothetical protein
LDGERDLGRLVRDHAMAGGFVGGSVGDAELADARFAGAGRPNWVEIRFDDDALTP